MYYSYNFLKPFPTAIISYDLNSKSKIKFTYSKRVQRTTTFKMNPFPEREHSETLEQGDPSLLPEFVDNIEIGYDNSFSDKFSFFSNLFFRKTNNLINRVNNVYNDSILNRIYSNVGNSSLYDDNISYSNIQKTAVNNLISLFTRYCIFYRFS